MERIIDDLDLPRVLHGVDATARQFIDEAIRRGYGTRIGFEDTPTLREGHARELERGTGASRAATLTERLDSWLMQFMANDD